ncbi:MAG: hypothetical protein QMB25_02890 [Pseudomonadales bacterium]|jgi:hypothetical protein|tara:strand:- start:1660 stop:2088 length:429 start_codon:yes stop_codon:yes gene_type:complete
MIKKQLLVASQQDSIRLYATENPCAKCPSGCTSVAHPPLQGLQTIDFMWPSAHLNMVAFCLFGLPLLVLIATVWFIDSYAGQIASSSLGRGGLVIALTVSLGMLLGGRLAHKKSLSLLLTLKDAIAVPTILPSKYGSLKKTV